MRCLSIALFLASTTAVAFGSVSAPVLKWDKGGCFASWCQTGWYGSPAVADLDGDGPMEVIWAPQDLVILDGATGALEKRTTGTVRSWPGIGLVDLTGDGTKEIVVGRQSNQLTAYDRTGTTLWTRNPCPSSGNEVRTLALDDLDGNGSVEIVAGCACYADFLQTNVYEPDGTARPGWPARHTGDPGNGWGMFNENVALGNLDGDSDVEIWTPTDTHYISAFDDDGSQLPANAMFGAGKVWSQIGVNVDQAADVIGDTDCDTQYRPNFANCAPAIGDVDGNGTLELVTAGDVYDCNLGDPDGDLYILPWILKLDRTRWSNASYDWTIIPAPGLSTVALSQDYDVIENNVHNAALADLDGDGNLEILVPSYDGKLHAWWLDKTEHGSWPFVVPGAGFRFATEPAVVDLDDDGKAEVIVASWPQKGSNYSGQLFILSSTGTVLHSVSLPVPYGGEDWNGALAAPTIANIDADADYEAVLGTSSTGVVAYDLPGSSAARILWGTGRGTYRRTGRPPVGTPTEASGPSVPPIKATKGTGTSINATFGPACNARNHAVYWGLGFPGGVSWAGVACNQGADGFATFDPGAQSLVYFVVVGQTATSEGSYGTRTGGIERPEAAGLPGGALCDRPLALGGICP